MRAAQQPSERLPFVAPLLPAEEAWNVSFPSAPSAQGTLDGFRVYIPLQSGELVAVNRETGVNEWSVMLPSSWPPVVGDGVLYAAGNREVGAVKATTGDIVWRASLDGETMAAPVLQGETLFLLTMPDQLRAVRTSDGSEIWQRTIGTLSTSATMTADAEAVYVSSGSHVTRLASSDGRLEWDRQLSGVLSPLVVAGDRVFVGSTDNFFYTLEAGTGRLAWRPWRAGGDVVGAAADERFVYVASLDNLLRAFRRGNGNQVWKRALSTRTKAPPSTFGGIVIVSGNDPTLSTFNASTGAPIGKFSISGDLQGVPLIDPALEPFRVAMVAVTRDGRAIGLRATGMMFRELPVSALRVLPGKPLSREPLAPPAAQMPPSEGSGSPR